GVLKAAPLKVTELVEQVLRARNRRRPYLCDTAAYVREAIGAGRRVLFEGAHGVMLDIDHGTYPYVTSSNCGASAVFGGAGVAPGQLDGVLGISKAYARRAGGQSARRGSGIRQRDRTAAANRMVRRSAGAPCRQAQRDGRTGSDQA